MGTTPDHTWVSVGPGSFPENVWSVSSPLPEETPGARLNCDCRTVPEGRHGSILRTGEGKGLVGRELWDPGSKGRSGIVRVSACRTSESVSMIPCTDTPSGGYDEGVENRFISGGTMSFPSGGAGVASNPCVT